MKRKDILPWLGKAVELVDGHGILHVGHLRVAPHGSGFVLVPVRGPARVFNARDVAGIKASGFDVFPAGECPQTGAAGIHSESWHDGGGCVWCGARNDEPNGPA